MRRLLAILLLLFCLCTAQGQALVRLPGTSATLECYPADTSHLSPFTSHLAVVVCPGGSYSWHDYKVEGVEVAQWLQAHGIAAYVLRYRVQGWWAWATHYRLLFRGNQYPDPLRDAEAALDWLAVHADSLAIDPRQIGVMGFSAGGHLAMLTTYTRRPAFVVPVYPVVTMRQACCHSRSRRALLGEYGKNNQSLRDSLSIELHVRPDCPPVFLVNCVDDPIVDYHNSVLLDSALTANNISHRYIQYRTGGHGFGMSETKGSPECRPWKEEFLKWIKGLYK
ncbi:MAG: alpha/beta hydrolase [Bacteroidales bacterium]|nr:alpha/beta hydrolase [Bacteroidales bacterium]